MRLNGKGSCHGSSLQPRRRHPEPGPPAGSFVLQVFRVADLVEAVRETVRTLRNRRTEETGFAENQRDPMPMPDQLAESNELGALIRRALATLSPDRRRAVKAHLMGFDVQEIMTMQSWPYNKARNLIVRGMADLRRELVRRGVHA